MSLDVNIESIAPVDDRAGGGTRGRWMRRRRRGDVRRREPRNSDPHAGEHHPLPTDTSDGREVAGGNVDLEA